MRPRELTVNGFRSYAEEVTFSWEDRTLVGIVGPIGSGKSSILDAIAFALYGKTPRIERDTKSLINQRRDAMHVSLTFDVDGGTWRAVRALRRNGASSHVLYRIEDDEQVEVTDKSREMSERIETLLGLDFDAFRRSVLLAQNQFAAFLEATGTDRNQVLKGVFGFERLDAMRALVKDRLDEVDRSLATLAGRRSSGEADARDLVVKQEHLAAAEQREKALEELRVPFEEARTIRTAAESRAEEAGRRLDRLEAIAERIPTQERISEVVASAGRGDEAVAAARHHLEEATNRRRAGAAEMEAALEAAGGRSGLEEIAAQVHEWRTADTRNREAAGEAERAAAEAVAAAEEAAGCRRGLAEAEEAVGAAEQGAATARERLEAARSALADARQQHGAHALRAELEVGSPCPVCAQLVTDLPGDTTPASLDEAAGAVSVAEQEQVEAASTREEAGRLLADARSATAVAEEQLARADTAAASATRARDAAGERLAELAAAVGERLGDGDPVERLSAVRRDVDDAERRLAAARSAEEEAGSVLSAAQEDAGASAAALTTVSSELAAVAGALDLRWDPGDGPQGLLTAAIGVREAWIGRQQAATGDRERAIDERDAAEAALGELLAAAGIGSGDDVVEVIAAARAERAAVEAEVQLLEQRLAELERLADDESALVGRAETLRTLHGDLAPSRFLEFVLDERRRALGDLASEHLEVLTNGRYRFDESGEFLLVDLTAANSVRAPASLSGGETFLASLGLALALAEMVAREGGRLDAFFLDEGFGSLDPEHLDLAMDGVERLVSTGAGRLVVVVSHVPTLRERIEDLIVLDRDPASGNTRVVAGLA